MKRGETSGSGSLPDFADDARRPMRRPYAGKAPGLGLDHRTEVVAFGVSVFEAIVSMPRQVCCVRTLVGFGGQ